MISGDLYTAADKRSSVAIIIGYRSRILHGIVIFNHNIL